MFEKRKILGPGAVLLFFALPLFVAAPAHAYLDPATGTVIGQALIAALAAGVVAFRVYWARIKRLFRRTGAGGSGGQEEQRLAERLRLAGRADRRE